MAVAGEFVKNSHVGRRLTAALLAMIASLGLASPATAQGLKLANDADATEIADLTTGEQLVLERADRTVDFAGSPVTLRQFSGILGYASEVAYVVVIDGVAEAGGTRATRGKMLLIPPYGAEVMRQRFDAGRLGDVWNVDMRTRAPATYASLERLSSAQARGVALGRFGKTNFNVAASGVAADELARRTVVGGKAIRDIRFSGERNPEAIERTIVGSLVAALIAGDAHAVASLMDPVPYGNTDLRAGADDARLLMAASLVASRDWRAVLGTGEARRGAADNVWVVAGPAGTATVTLRPMGDFSYVRNVTVGG